MRHLAHPSGGASLLLLRLVILARFHPLHDDDIPHCHRTAIQHLQAYRRGTDLLRNRGACGTGEVSPYQDI